MADGVVIVGAAAAGWATAESLRRFGYDDAITLVDAEDRAPYDRPPLSKHVLTGQWEADHASLISPERMAKVDAHVLLGLRATSLSVEERTVRLSSGKELGYDELVIATGVHPRSLESLPNASLLRTMDDSLLLRSRLLARPELVVVGAGFIGLEVAASARTLGSRVTVVEPMQEPLANRVGSVVASKLLDRHRDEGVGFRLGVGVVGTDLAGSVLLTDGTVLDSAHVLTAIGCSPTTGWLSGSSIDITDGVLCDAFGRAAPGVWAVGDVARWHDASTGRTFRVEHRQNAAEQGAAVARSIAVGPTETRIIPYFWTDQYDVKLQVAGRIDAHCTARVVEGDPAQSSFVMVFETEGRLSAVLGWNAAKAMLPYRRELAQTP